MKIKALLALLASSVYLSACACKLTIVNNTPFKATVYNNITKKSANVLSWEDTKVGKGDERTDINLSIFTLFGAQEKKFHLKQIACSDSHQIKLYVQDVLDGKLGKDGKLFRVKQIKIKK